LTRYCIRSDLKGRIHSSSLMLSPQSIGCPSVGTTANPVAFSPSNPGLMQSAGGTSFVGNRASAKDQENSIQQMIADGVRGTSKGNGLLQVNASSPSIFLDINV
jgi:hypothetical protein